MACVATLVIFTIARGHYYMLLLPANVFVPLWLVRSGKRAIRAADGHRAADSGARALHWCSDIAGRIGVLGLGTTLWYFTSCGVLLTAPLSSRAASRRESASTAADRIRTSAGGLSGVLTPPLHVEHGAIALILFARLAANLAHHEADRQRIVAHGRRNSRRRGRPAWRFRTGH